MPFEVKKHYGIDVATIDIKRPTVRRWLLEVQKQLSVETGNQIVV